MIHVDALEGHSLYLYDLEAIIGSTIKLNGKAQAPIEPQSRNEMVDNRLRVRSADWIGG